MHVVPPASAPPLSRQTRWIRTPLQQALWVPLASGLFALAAPAPPMGTEAPLRTFLEGSTEDRPPDAILLVNSTQVDQAGLAALRSALWTYHVRVQPVGTGRPAPLKAALGKHAWAFAHLQGDILEWGDLPLDLDRVASLPPRHGISSPLESVEALLRAHPDSVPLHIRRLQVIGGMLVRSHAEKAEAAFANAMDDLQRCDQPYVQASELSLLLLSIRHGRGMPLVQEQLKRTCQHLLNSHPFKTLDYGIIQLAAELADVFDPQGGRRQAWEALVQIEAFPQNSIPAGIPAMLVQHARETGQMPRAAALLESIWNQSCVTVMRNMLSCNPATTHASMVAGRWQHFGIPLVEAMLASGQAERLPAFLAELDPFWHLAPVQSDCIQRLQAMSPAPPARVLADLRAFRPSPFRPAPEFFRGRPLLLVPPSGLQPACSQRDQLARSGFRVEIRERTPAWEAWLSPLQRNAPWVLVLQDLRVIPGEGGLQPPLAVPLIEQLRNRCSDDVLRQLCPPAESQEHLDLLLEARLLGALSVMPPAELHQLDQAIEAAFSERFRRPVTQGLPWPDALCLRKVAQVYPDAPANMKAIAHRLRQDLEPFLARHHTSSEGWYAWLGAWILSGDPLDLGFLPSEEVRSVGVLPGPTDRITQDILRHLLQQNRSREILQVYGPRVLAWVTHAKAYGMAPNVLEGAVEATLEAAIREDDRTCVEGILEALKAAGLTPSALESLAKLASQHHREGIERLLTAFLKDRPGS